MKIYTRFVPVLLAAALLTGCSGETSSVPSEIVINGATAEQTAPVYPVKLPDGTMIAAAPETTASLSPAATEILSELGYADSLAAVCRYCDYPEGLTAQTAGSSENPDIDKLTQLHPDVLFTMSPLAEREVYALEEAGITVVELSAPVTVEDYGSLYGTVASVFAGGEAGKTAADKAVSALKAAASSAELGTFIYVTPKLTAAGADTFEGAVLSLCGDNLCTASGYADSAEAFSGTPKYIVAADSLTEDDISGSELFSALLADGAKLMFVPSERFERPSGRLAEVFGHIGETE